MDAEILAEQHMIQIDVERKEANLQKLVVAADTPREQTPLSRYSPAEMPGTEPPGRGANVRIAHPPNLHPSLK